MPTVSIDLNDEQNNALMDFAIDGEDNIGIVVSRLINDLLQAPRADDVSGFKPVMAPAWFHELGTVHDKIVAAGARDIEPDSKELKASDAARVAAIRNSLGIQAARQQGKPRKFDDKYRIGNWNAIKKAKLSNTAVIHALGFRNSHFATVWAEKVGLTDLVERLGKRTRPQD